MMIGGTGLLQQLKRAGNAMKRGIIFVLTIFISFGGALAEEKPELKEAQDRVSYSLGYKAGGDFKHPAVDLDPQAFLKGVEDVLAEAEPRLSREEMRSILSEVKKKILADKQRQKVAAVKRHIEEGQAFLAENAGKEGVVSLPSGVQYRVIREGKGRQPGPSDEVTVHYRGTLIDGTEFGSSYRKGGPQTYHVSGVIRGLTEALQLMKEGGRWKIFIPAERAFSKRGPLGHRTVIYDLELISVKSPE
jgi:FKBP-type peptidyl-prolyl cis-trans isomerase FklB